MPSTVGVRFEKREDSAFSHTPSLHGRMETALEGLVVHDVDRAPPVRANGLMIRGREAAHDWQVIQYS